MHDLADDHPRRGKPYASSVSWRSRAEAVVRDIYSGPNP